MKKTQKQPETPLYKLATEITEALEAQGKTMMDLALAIDMTYEHVRKICHGLAFPSKFMLREICKFLDLDEPKMDDLLKQDKILREYGEMPQALTGKDPRYTKIEMMLPKISEDQFQIIVGQLEGWSKQNRRKQ
jgi:transcriptional regulator with XRE-family HTH domain